MIKKYRFIQIIIVLVVIALLSVIFIFKGKHQGQRPKELSALYKSDIATLENSKSLETDISAALIRLGRARDPLTYKYGLKMVTHSSSIMRRAAALSLGYYDDDNVSKSFMLLIKDPDEAVRLAALEGLGHSNSTERFHLVGEISKYSTLSPEEQFQVLLSFLAISKVADKNSVIDDLLKVISKLKSDQEYAAILRIVALEPNNEKLKQFFQKKITDAKNAEIVAIGIKYLGRLGDSWILSRLPQELQNRNVKIRRAALEVIPVLCPKNRWLLLEQAVNTEADDSVLLTAAQIADQLGGELGSTLITKILKRPALKTKKIKDEIQKLSIEFKIELRPEICIKKS